MPAFTVQCVSKQSGKPYTIHVDALSQQHAEDAAAAEGHVVQPGATTAKGVAPPAAAPTDVHMEVRALRAELRDFQDTISKIRFLRRPRDTIATSVFMALVAFGVLLLILSFFYPVHFEFRPLRP